MNQPTLQFPPASRRTDPASSKAAEQRITNSGARQTQADQILALVKQRPGRTSAELTLHCNFDRFQIARRLPDLERNGQVHRGDMRNCGVVKQACVTWWPGPAPAQQQEVAA